MDGPIDLSGSLYEPVQKVWDLHNQILLKRGIDLNQLLLRWVRTQKESFRDPRSSFEFDELCDHGCVPQVLSALLSLARHSPKLVTVWDSLVGDTASRRALTKSLEDAAAAIEIKLRDFIASEDEKQRQDFQAIGRIPLSDLVAELRLYASFVKLAEIFKVDVETRSPEEFAGKQIQIPAIRKTALT